MLNRTIAPATQALEKVSILGSEKHNLSNHIPVYAIRAGEQPVVRLELIFEAGSKYDTSIGVSQFTAKMLSEGTEQHSAAAIAAAFDKFGAFFDCAQTLDRLTLTVHCLTKYLSEILPLLQEILTTSTFPEKELETAKNITSQTLKVNLEKTAYVAGQLIREKIFSAKNPYGQSIKEEDIQAINQLSLKNFYEKHIQNKGFKVFISGKFDNHDLEFLNHYFGQNPVQWTANELQNSILENNIPKETLIEKEGSVQSSIRIGKMLIGRKHPDFFKFIVTNTIFGGFFGSRLMKNIREEKGFTYGISSGLVQLSEASYLSIGTDVKREFTTQTIEEIHKEIIRLQTEEVSENELEVAKNYMIGAFVGSLNTPFEVADRQKIIILENLPTDFYDDYIHKIRSVSAHDVYEMANQYLKIEELSTVIVGGK